MEDNKIQLSLEEQLEQLKKEQEEAKRICDKRIDMGMLYHDSASVQELAAEILDRKIKIKELEEQIAQKGIAKSKQDENELIEYKPKMNIFQWVRAKLDKLKENIQNSRKAKMSKLKIEDPDVRYEEIVNNANKNAKKTNPWDLNPEELEVVAKGYEENSAKQEQLEEGELSPEELGEVNSYQVGIAPRYDYPKKDTEQKGPIKYNGR